MKLVRHSGSEGLGVATLGLSGPRSNMETSQRLRVCGIVSSTKPSGKIFGDATCPSMSHERILPKHEESLEFSACKPKPSLNSQLLTLPSNTRMSSKNRPMSTSSKKSRNGSHALRERGDGLTLWRIVMLMLQAHYSLIWGHNGHTQVASSLQVELRLESKPKHT